MDMAHPVFGTDSCYYQNCRESNSCCSTTTTKQMRETEVVVNLGPRFSMFLIRITLGDSGYQINQFQRHDKQAIIGQYIGRGSGNLLFGGKWYMWRLLFDRMEIQHLHFCTLYAQVPKRAWNFSVAERTTRKFFNSSSQHNLVPEVPFVYILLLGMTPPLKFTFHLNRFR